MKTTCTTPLALAIAGAEVLALFLWGLFAFAGMPSRLPSPPETIEEGLLPSNGFAPSSPALLNPSDFRLALPAFGSRLIELSLPDVGGGDESPLFHVFCPNVLPPLVREIHHAPELSACC